MKVDKLAAVVPISTETLRDAPVQFGDAIRAYYASTPAERAAAAERYRLERAAKRAAAPRVELTVDHLIDKLGWSRAYAEHFVQGYCDCGDSMMGWEHCIHANDEGVSR